jgi:hypothetical protein
MAKCSNQSIDESDIKCEHGGVYEDPVTEKARQFDIRGLLELGQINRVRLAVECKNIRENFPLVVLTVPRSVDESYHEFISSHAPAYAPAAGVAARRA